MTAETTPDTLEARIDRVAQAPVLLVATDYDGTLAPIVDDPAKALPHREGLVAVQVLALLHQTHVAVISGRSLEELGRFTSDPPGVHLVGSHGSEFEPDFAETLSFEQAELLTQIIADLEQIANSGKKFIVETKPASVAFHYRGADADAADRAVEAVMAGPAARAGVHVRSGKMVVELSVVETNKGHALHVLRQRVGATAVVFLGDDRTDEDAFAELTGPDVGIKVGKGETAAEFRVADPGEVAKILARIAQRRGEWLAGSGAHPIQDHSMLSDARTIALVDPQGSIAWFCAPRIDAPAVFAELLGGPSAGRFRVSPVESNGAPPKQTYENDSLVLTSEWDGLSVTDYLDCSSGRPSQRAGRSDLVRVIEGSRPVRIEFAPRLDFGRVPTTLCVRDGGLEIEDSFDPIVLRAPGVSWEIVREGVHESAVATVEASALPLTLELRFGAGSLRESIPPEPQRRLQTSSFWADWTARLSLPELQPELVRRSALAIKALVYEPTGAISAAATTSLPESIGGVRNWDYRYCWPRDAAMGALALVRLGSNHEAMRLLDWVLGVVDALPSPERLRPIYTVTGAELPPEAEIPELSGYAGSRPVRISNGAAGQIQLDVIGPVVELISELAERGAPLSSEHWRLTDALLHAVRARWAEPDHGIWEIRGARRHHTHSKVMCWLAADCGCKVAVRLLGRDKPEWTDLRDQISADILEQGYDEKLGAFTAAYGEHIADASVLTIGLTGMLPPSDERFMRTIGLIESLLLEEGLVYRYKADDGLPGKEGAFLLCTAWYIEALALTGRADEARELFDRFCRRAGVTGLLAEQHEPGSDRALGNHPQVYSHLGLINCALRLSGGSDRIVR